MKNNKKYFISIKWKVLGLLTVLLLLSHIAQYLLGNSFFVQKYEEHRLQDQQYQIRLIHELIKQSSRFMEQAAETVPILFGATERLQEKNSVEVSQYWNNQQANWGVSAAYQFNADKQIINNWGLALSHLIAREKIELVAKSEKPSTALVCAKQCYQLVYTPTMMGVLVLARTYADVIFAFKEITGNDVALLRPINDKGSSQNWGYELMESSSRHNVSKLVESVSIKFKAEELLGQERIIQKNSKKLGVKLVQLTRSKGSKSPVLLFVSDVSADHTQMEEARGYSVKILLVSLALTTFFMLLVLMSYIKRVIAVISALPALSLGEFGLARNTILDAKRGSILPHYDELNLLTESALLVTQQLEDGQKQINLSTQLLTTQNKTIAQEHQYVSELLATAPVIILSQSVDGKITSINSLGCELLGLTNELVISKHFDNFFIASKNSKGAPALSDFRTKPIGTLELETYSMQLNEPANIISWVHKSIVGHSGEQVILSIGQDITVRKEAEDGLIWLVDHDPLTNLYNRRFFHKVFEQQINISERYRETGAVLFFDLDNFKYINDISGHKAGDELLMIIADTLKEIVRASDTLARLGGDEFAILIPETNVQGACLLATKVLESLDLIAFSPSGYQHKILASIGIVMFPDAGLNVEDLMANADIAMYNAKGSGRGCWHVYTDQDHEREHLTMRVQWKDKIESAIKENRFVLHYQPILDIEKNKVTHIEALVRLLEPNGELVMPSNFIMVAEQTGLINQIDMLVLRMAFNKLRSLQAERSSLSLSVNLSGKAFNNSSLLAFLKRELAQPDIDPKKMIIEVTETTAIENYAAAKDMMAQVSELGAKFALDDFGVGFSSFHHLRHLDVAYIKIDGAFIRQLGNHREDEILVKSIVDIAKYSGKKTIAEFVENEEVLAKVRALGVDYAQGYYVAKSSAELPN